MVASGWATAEGVAGRAALERAVGGTAPRTCQLVGLSAMRSGTNPPDSVVAARLSMDCSATFSVGFTQCVHTQARCTRQVPLSTFFVKAIFLPRPRGVPIRTHSDGTFERRTSVDTLQAVRHAPRTVHRTAHRRSTVDLGHYLVRCTRARATQRLSPARSAAAATPMVRAAAEATQGTRRLTWSLTPRAPTAAYHASGAGRQTIQRSSGR